jgi:hypothetical protein
MSERVKLQNSYDPTKELTVKLSASYIAGVEAVFMDYVTKMENPGNIKPMIEKFEKYIEDPEGTLKNNPFTQSELHFYTLYSLIELFKAAAYAQGANIDVNATVAQDDISALLKASLEGDSDEMRKINDRINKDIESQLS